jgi:hypothetical protein
MVWKCFSLEPKCYSKKQVSPAFGADKDQLTTGICLPFPDVSCSLPKHWFITFGIPNPRQSRTPISRYWPTEDVNCKSENTVVRKDVRLTKHSADDFHKHEFVRCVCAYSLVVVCEGCRRTDDGGFLTMLFKSLVRTLSLE